MSNDRDQMNRNAAHASEKIRELHIQINKMRQILISMLRNEKTAEEAADALDMMDWEE